MLNNKKRVIALILAILTAFAVFAGCAKNNNNNTVQTSGSAAEDDDYRTLVPQGYNAGGFEFVILNAGDFEIKGCLNDIVITDYDSTSNDYVSEAMYNRNATIENKLNCAISEINDSSGVLVSKIDVSRQAGTDDYSLCNII